MPAPKGNKFAAKENPKTSGYRLKMRPEALQALKKISVREKTSMAQIIERTLLAQYPKEFDGKM